MLNCLFLSAIKNNQSWLKDEILNIAGTNISHVSNAYSGQPFIWLYFHPEPLKTDDFGVAACIKVPYGEHEPYKRTLAKEFMTGIVENADGQLETLFYNYPIKLNRSYIVLGERERDVIQSNYETDQIWHDSSSNFKCFLCL